MILELTIPTGFHGFAVPVQVKCADINCVRYLYISLVGGRRTEEEEAEQRIESGAVVSEILLSPSSKNT